MSNTNFPQPEWNEDVRPDEKTHKLFQGISSGAEINQRDIQILEQLREKLSKIATQTKEEQKTDQAAYLEEHIAWLLEYINNIFQFTRELQEKQKEMRTLQQDSSPWQEAKDFCEWRIAAIRQNQKAVQEIGNRLSQIPQQKGYKWATSLAHLAAATMAVLAPLVLLTSFNSDDSGQVSRAIPGASSKAKGGKPEKGEKQIFKHAKAKGNFFESIEDDEGFDDDGEGEGEGAGGSREFEGKGSGKGGAAGGNDSEGEPAGWAPEEKGEKPNVKSRGKPGEIAEGKDIGRFDFADENMRDEFDDALWVTGISTPMGAKISYALQEGEGGALVANAYLDQVAVEKEKAYQLPHPIGTTVEGVRVHPEIPFELRNGEIVFEKNASVTIRYNIRKSATTFVDNGKIQDEKNELESEEKKDAREKIVENPDTVEETLDSYLEKFTYITSNQLQRLIDALPGGFQDKAQFIKFGDCDVLAHHAAGLLQEAEMPAAVATGFLDKGVRDTFFSGLRHGQVVYQKPNGVAAAYETTVPAVANGAYANLRFTRKDYSRLAEIVGRAQNTKSPQELQASYEEFDQALREILQQERYQKYRLKKGNDELSEQDKMKKLMEKMEKLLPKLRIKPDKENYKPGEVPDELIIILLGLIGLSAGGIAAYPRTLNREVWDIRGRIGAIFSEEAETKESKETEYGFHHDVLILEGVFEKLNPAQQRIMTMIAGFVEAYGKPRNGPWGLLGYLIAKRGKVRKILKEMERNGFSEKEIAGIIQKTLENPRVRKEMKEAHEEMKKEVLEEAKKIIKDWMGVDRKITPAQYQRIKTDVLNIKRVGGEPTRNKEAQKTGWAGVESHPYQQGDDIRDVDRSYYARSGKLRTLEREPEGDNTAKEKFTLAIEIAEVDPGHLASLTAFLYFANRHPDLVAIEGVEIYAYGRRLDEQEAAIQTFEGQKGKKIDPTNILKKLCEMGRGGIENIQAFIRHLIDLRYKHSLMDRSANYPAKQVSYAYRNSVTVVSLLRSMEQTGYQDMAPQKDKPRKSYLLTGISHQQVDVFGKKRTQVNDAKDINSFSIIDNSNASVPSAPTP